MTRIISLLGKLSCWTAVTVIVMSASVASAQQSFKSPEDAVAALVGATRDNWPKGAVAVLGAAGADIVSSGDKAADDAMRQKFLAAYDARHQVTKEGDNRAVVIIGPEDFPFPIPLTRKGAAWQFDTAAGRLEILYRRIGRNELSAIQASLAFVDAQNEYAEKDRTGAGGATYAQRIVSGTNKKDGLYWPAAPGENASPLGELVARATTEGYAIGGGRTPFHGYYFRILTRQGPMAAGGEVDYVVRGKMIGGFALVAYPAEYGNSGVMTFVVNYAGTVFPEGPRGAHGEARRAHDIVQSGSNLEEGGCHDAATMTGSKCGSETWIGNDDAICRGEQVRKSNVNLKRGKLTTALSLSLTLLFSPMAGAQEILPFPPAPSASTPGLTIQDSTYKKRVEPKRLADGAPNILIILMDDVGPGTPSTYGGEINTPTLDRVANMGISYNRFHSTAMCSPTRAALLTGRNHTFVGNGQIAAIANDFDGFSGTIPKSSATVAEVLKNYGYNTGAWGKWHNTPEEQITSKGPFEYWPTGYGFEYFYGFLAGEASQYEPTLTRNTTQVTEEPRKGYHLTDDIAEDAIKWLREQKAYAPDKPFLMYWAPGASHGPHQIMKEWADKYKGKFDDGWDAYRERVFKRAKEKGWIPQDAQLTPRPESMASWASIPEDEKPFQRRLMEVFAGFTEHADYNAGRVIDEIQRQGKLDNTLIFYIWGDNGSSAEGLNGTISEQLAQNGIPTKISQHLEALKELGGLDALGGPKTDNMYHAGWAWAGSTPYRSTKLVGAHFGGTRQPMAVAWPKGIKPDATPRPQFHHVIDIVPTIYEQLKIAPPKVVNGFEQDPIHGISMSYTLADAKAPGQRKTQFFDIMASRGIYHDGWFASAPGPARAVGRRNPEGHQGLVAPDRQMGALQSRQGLEPGQRPRRCESAEARGDEGAVPARIHQEQEPPDRRRPVVHRAVPSGGCSCFVPDRMDLRRADDPDAGIRSAQARQGRQPRQHGGGRAGERQRRALRAGRLLRGRDLLLQGRHPQLRVQPVRDHAHQDQGEGKAAGRQGEDRGRIETRRQNRRSDERHAEGEWQGRGAGHGAGRDVASFHIERDLRYRPRSRFAGIARLFRQGAVCVQRHHRHD